MTLYDKEGILAACAGVFAAHGYRGASTQMLSEAAGVSKALLFHHFKNKKELYLSSVERAVRHYHASIRTEGVPNLGFFEGLEQYAPIKLRYCLKHPDLYAIIRDAFYASPPEVREEIRHRYGDQKKTDTDAWYALFEAVKLRPGVDRALALELIMMTMDGFERRFLAEMGENRDDGRYLRDFVERFLGCIRMIRRGIEEED
jgi:AcrR family transcriptional regulator